MPLNSSVLHLVRKCAASRSHCIIDITFVDDYEDFAAPVAAAASFILALVNARAKTTFMPILHFINSVLDSWALLALYKQRQNILTAFP